jgi:hypothetical protein
MYNTSSATLGLNLRIYKQISGIYFLEITRYLNIREISPGWTAKQKAYVHGLVRH